MKNFAFFEGQLVELSEEALHVLHNLPEAERPEILDESSASVQQALVVSAREMAAAKVIAFLNRIREEVAGAKHYLQAARWPIQLAAAQAIEAGHASAFDTAVMAREARLRGLNETIEQLAQKVIANSLIFASVGAAVDGIERAALDSINAHQGPDSATFDEILIGAQSTAMAELLDIFTPVYGAEQAKAMADRFFGEVRA